MKKKYLQWLGFIWASLFIILGLCTVALSQQTVKVGIYDNNPLVYQNSEGQPRGLTVDVLNYIADLEDWRLEYRFGSWKECLDWLRSGETDLQVAIIPTPERQLQFDFTTEFVFTLWGQVYTASGAQISSILDLPGKRIGLYGGSVPAVKFEEMIDSFGVEATLVHFSDYGEIAEKVSTSELDAGVFIRSFGEKYAGQYGLLKTPIIFNPLHLRYATLKGDERGLLAAIDSHLAALKADHNSYYYRSLDQHFDSSSKSVFPQWITPILVASAAILVILVVVTWYQGLSVRQKERVRRAAEARHSSLFHAMPIGVVYQNSSGRIIMANSMAEKILGLSLEQMLGKTSMDPDWEAVDENGETLAGEKHPAMLALSTGKPVTEVVLGVRNQKEEKTRWLLVNSTPEFLESSKKPFQVFSTFIDISRRIESAKALQAARDNLESTVARRTLELNEAVRELESIFNNSLIGIMVLKGGRFFHKGNQRLAEIFGYSSPDEMHNISMKELHLTERRFKEFGRKYYNKLQEKELLHVEYQLRRKDGTPIWCSLNGCAIDSSSPEGLDRGVIWIVDDITHRVHADNQLQDMAYKLNEAHQLSRSGWWEYDVHDDRVIWPEETYAIYGISPEVVLNYQTLLDAIPPEYHDYHNSQLEKIYRDGSADFTYPIVRADGEVCWIWARGETRRDENGKPVKLFGTVQDITDRKKIEKKLEEAGKQAESANRSKSIFLSSMSHELRTPLNAILGYTQILGGNENLSALQKNGIDTIHQAGEHLLNLINDILDMSKIEAGKLELVKSPVKAGPYFAGIIDFFRFKAREKGIEFFVELDEKSELSIHVDELRLRQVIFNLLSNAIKFTSSGYVLFSVKIDRLGGEEAAIHIFVEDSGIGIDKELQQAVFQPFQQAGDRLKRSEGSGLGLAISHQLITLMGGELRLESPVTTRQDGETTAGSRFSFSITTELAERVSTMGAQEKVMVTGYRPLEEIDLPLRVLVVDDIRSNRMLLRDVLSPFGFKVWEEDDGNKVVAASLQFRPHLVLMDLRMPGCDGFTALKHLRDNGELQSIPVVAVTASLTDEDSFEKRCLEHGFNSFLPKPIDLARLLGIIEKLLPLRFTHRQPPSAEEKIEIPTLKSPPPQILSELRDLLARGDISTIKQRAELSGLEDREHRDFYLRVQELADELNIVELEFLINSVSKGGQR